MGKTYAKSGKFKQKKKTLENIGILGKIGQTLEKKLWQTQEFRVKLDKLWKKNFGKLRNSGENWANFEKQLWQNLGIQGKIGQTLANLGILGKIGQIWKKKLWRT